MDDTVGTLFFKDKQVRLLAALTNTGKEWHLVDLAKEANVTYIHTSKFIRKCEAQGVVACEQHGRTKKLKLTEKGEKIAKSIADIKDSLVIEKEKEVPEPPAQK